MVGPTEGGAEGDLSGTAGGERVRGVLRERCGRCTVGRQPRAEFVRQRLEQPADAFARLMEVRGAEVAGSQKLQDVRFDDGLQRFEQV